MCTYVQIAGHLPQSYVPARFHCTYEAHPKPPPWLTSATRSKETEIRQEWTPTVHPRASFVGWVSLCHQNTCYHRFLRVRRRWRIGVNRCTGLDRDLTRLHPVAPVAISALPAPWPVWWTWFNRRSEMNVFGDKNTLLQRDSNHAHPLQRSSPFWCIQHILQTKSAHEGFICPLLDHFRTTQIPNSTKHEQTYECPFCVF